MKVINFNEMQYNDIDISTKATIVKISPDCYEAIYEESGVAVRGNFDEIIELLGGLQEEL